MDQINILNLGCGHNPLKDRPHIKYVNADMLKHKDIFKLNLLKLPYPWATETFDQVYLFHTIEHIPANRHHDLLHEIRRVLKPKGKLCISYPEFPKVARNYLENKDLKREWWATVIYGLGRSEWDRHKALMDTPFFIEVLNQVGFKAISAKPEKREEYNTVVIAEKSEPMPTYERLMEKEFSIPPDAPNQ